MKIDIRSFESNKTYSFSEDVDFSSHIFSETYRIRKIESCHADVQATLFDTCLIFQIKLVGKVIGVCAYTNEDVPLTYNVSEEMTFSSDKNTDDYYYNPNQPIDLDEYFFALIDAEIPQRIVKKGAKLPSGGEGYRVLTEEELEKERKSKGDPRWAALDNVELEEK